MYTRHERDQKSLLETLFSVSKARTNKFDIGGQCISISAAIYCLKASFYFPRERQINIYMFPIVYLGHDKLMILWSKITFYNDHLDLTVTICILID